MLRKALTLDKEFKLTVTARWRQRFDNVFGEWPVDILVHLLEWKVGSVCTQNYLHRSRSRMQNRTESQCLRWCKGEKTPT